MILAALGLVLGLAPQDAVVFVLDDVGLEDLREAHTPSLDALAEQGVSFTRAMANPTCSPSRRSLLFGEWWVDLSGPACQGTNGSEPPLADVSMADALPAHRAWLFGKWHLGASPSGGCAAPLDHGFDVWLAGTKSNLKSCGGTGYYSWLRVDSPGCREAISSQYAPLALREAFTTSWRGSRGPKVAVVCVQLAHDPFQLPPLELVTSVPTTERGTFLAMVEAADTIIGQALRDIDLARTLVIVTSDNGTPPEVAPDPRRAKNSCFERGIRVPLIVAGNKVQARGSVDLLTHLVDVYATVVEHCGGAPSGDGISLVPLLRGATQERRHEYVLCGLNNEVCVRSQRYKLRAIDRLPADGVYDVEEFYDVVADPEETVDRIGDAELEEQVRAHRAFLLANRPARDAFTAEAEEDGGSAPALRDDG